MLNTECTDINLQYISFSQVNLEDFKPADDVWPETATSLGGKSYTVDGYEQVKSFRPVNIHAYGCTVCRSDQNTM